MEDCTYPNTPPPKHHENQNKQLFGFLILSIAAVAFAIELVIAYGLNKETPEQKYTSWLGQAPLSGYTIIVVIIAILGIWLVATGNDDKKTPPPPTAPPPPLNDDYYTCFCDN